MESTHNTLDLTQSQTECFDKFRVKIDSGDYVEVQRVREKIKVYRKEDGELYFMPYGVEERVSSYFQNDLIKIKY